MLKVYIDAKSLLDVIFLEVGEPGAVIWKKVYGENSFKLKPPIPKLSVSRLPHLFGRGRGTWFTSWCQRSLYIDRESLSINPPNPHTPNKGQRPISQGYILFS